MRQVSEAEYQRLQMAKRLVIRLSEVEADIDCTPTKESEKLAELVERRDALIEAVHATAASFPQEVQP